MIEVFDIQILETGISHPHGSNLPILRSTKVPIRLGVWSQPLSFKLRKEDSGKEILSEIE